MGYLPTLSSSSFVNSLTIKLFKLVQYRRQKNEICDKRRDKIINIHYYNYNSHRKLIVTSTTLLWGFRNVHLNVQFLTPQLL